MNNTDNSVSIINTQVGSHKYSNGNIYLRIMAFVLIGYAFLGRGFAHIGIGMIYISEVTLFICLVLYLTTPSARMWFFTNTLKILAIVMVWGAICTIPYISTYGLNALRDAVIWGYGMFGIMIAGFLLSNPNRLKLVLDFYKRFAPFFIFGIIILYIFTKTLPIPTIPGSSVPIINFRISQILVHVTGCLLFYLLLSKRFGFLLMLMLVIEIILFGSISRAGLLAFLLSISFVFILRPFTNRYSKIVISVIFIVAIFLVSGLEFSTRKNRVVSPTQITSNLISIVSNAEDGTLQGTKNWRLDWWGKILNYTIFGDYFWTGKGYGINLADDDGFQVVSESKLRSPHNSHITILARSGLPGFILWLILMGSVELDLYLVYRKTIRDNNLYWSNIFLFLMGFITANLISASFSVYLEGPMGGIWFWTVFGVAVAAVEIYKRYPDIINGWQIVETR